MIKKAWDKFYGTGWKYGDEPSKRESFEAGFKAAIELTNAPEKKTVPEIIKEWQDKFNE